MISFLSFYENPNTKVKRERQMNFFFFISFLFFRSFRFLLSENVFMVWFYCDAIKSSEWKTRCLFIMAVFITANINLIAIDRCCQWTDATKWIHCDAILRSQMKKKKLRRKQKEEEDWMCNWGARDIISSFSG